MNVTVFSENMKKFRLAKKYTQEEVAEKLSVTAQTVSRWECGITLPDVLLLPEIAKIYGIIVDDLFKKCSVAYENYAQRLSALYEISDLINRIGLTLCGNVNKFNVTLCVNNKESHRSNAKACSATASEVLRLGLIFLLGIVVNTACCNTNGYL